MEGMSNADIAQAFERIALLLDLKGDENPFRIRAYERASMTVDGLARQLRDIYEEGGLKSLKALPGIGADLALKIEEHVRTGKISYLAELEKEFPPGLLKIMQIEGIGPKKTKLLWKKFRVGTIEELIALAHSGELQKLKGWGEKSVQNILRGIEMQKKVGGRLPIFEAWPIAEEIAQSLRDTGLCGRVEVAGSLRRRRETVGDIDILATGKDPERIMDIFCALPHVDNVIAKGKTKSTVFLKAGLDADLRVVDAAVFGAALHYFTGSKDHNVHIRRLAIRSGVTISEYGVYRGTARKKGSLVAAETEEEVFATIGLPYIPPELREDRGEVEAAQQNRLPVLLEERDLKGDLHMHSAFSDGTASMEEMARAAKRKGLTYIAITDHASQMGMVKGIKKENIDTYLARIEEARSAVPGIRILAGAEVDILEDGSLYLPDEILARLDWVVASVHQHFRKSREETTARVLRAMENPHVRVLGHPTARMLGKREGIDLDIDRVLHAAKEHRVAVELNASVWRLDLNDFNLRRAKDIGAMIAVGSDAHAAEGLEYRFGVAQARRGWIEKADVLNTRSVRDVLAFKRSVRDA